MKRIVRFLLFCLAVASVLGILASPALAACRDVPYGFSPGYQRTYDRASRNSADGQEQPRQARLSRSERPFACFAEGKAHLSPFLRTIHITLWIFRNPIVGRFTATTNPKKWEV